MWKNRKTINHKENIGKKFNRLEILDVVKRYYGNKGCYAFYYKCKCDCGNEKEVRAEYVLDGQIKSCGCYKLERNKEMGHFLGLTTRKHEEKCEYCGKEEHYAKGLCRNCYARYLRNGFPELKKDHKD